MKVDAGRLLIGRFQHKADLLYSITEKCKSENIRLGIFSVIGALVSARLGYYDQDEKQYVECVHLDKKLEITSCVGNVSLNEADIFVHAHITLADHTGNCYGGHLMPGSMIFVAEYFMQELTGVSLERKFDSATGLRLWDTSMG